MRTFVGGKAEDDALAHIGVPDLRARPRDGERERQQQQSPAERMHHQSSRTARTALMLVAERALPRAVSVASPTSAIASTASATQGTCSAMPQWNDCRLTTWTRIRLIANPSTTPHATPMV